MREVKITRNITTSVIESVTIEYKAGKIEHRRNPDIEVAGMDLSDEQAMAILNKANPRAAFVRVYKESGRYAMSVKDFIANAAKLENESEQEAG